VSEIPGLADSARSFETRGDMSDKGIDKIISHIKANVDREISGMLQEAHAEAESIKKAARQKAEAEAQKILSQGERAAALEGQRIIAEKRLEVRRRKMDAQEEAIAASFEAATMFLEELVEKGEQDHLVYKDILFNLVASACEIVAGEKVELALNKRDSGRFDEKMMGELSGFVKKKTGRDISLCLANTTIQCLGGVIVRDLEKQLEVDNTLEAKLDRLRESIRVDVAKMLFGDEL
jgi:V/A-type H+/Na+-transporting ATPase subunit E